MLLSWDCKVQAMLSVVVAPPSQNSLQALYQVTPPAALHNNPFWKVKQMKRAKLLKLRLQKIFALSYLRNRKVTCKKRSTSCWQLTRIRRINLTSLRESRSLSLRGSRQPLPEKWISTMVCSRLSLRSNLKPWPSSLQALGTLAQVRRSMSSLNRSRQRKGKRYLQKMSIPM